MNPLKILLVTFAGLLVAQETQTPPGEPTHFRLTCLGNGGCVANFPTIPSDKRLWIRHVSTRVRPAYGSIAWADAAIGARADNHGCTFSSLYWVPLQPTGHPSGYFVANQPMHAFIDPDPKCASQILADANGYIEADFTITGYLTSK